MWSRGEQQRLVLILAEDVHYVTDFLMSQLVDSLSLGGGFTASDAAEYQNYSELLANAGFDQEWRFKLAINATVALNYLKPLATRSWYFRLAETPYVGEIKPQTWVQLDAQTNAKYLVLRVDEQASYLMLVNVEHQVNGVKTLKRGNIIKVHNDRLSPLNELFQAKL